MLTWHKCPFKSFRKFFLKFRKTTIILTLVSRERKKIKRFLFATRNLSASVSRLLANNSVREEDGHHLHSPR